MKVEERAREIITHLGSLRGQLAKFQDEFRKYHVDSYINMGGPLQIVQWRTLQPLNFFELVNAIIQRRLN